MLPMSVKCDTCGHFMKIGTKMNMRKETVIGEDYLGIEVLWFYMRCLWCSALATFKTDPKNSNYVVENGVTRNYEPWRDVEAAKHKMMEQRLADE